MNTVIKFALAAAFSLSSASGALAQDGHQEMHQGMHHDAQQGSAASSGVADKTADGEVRKVDKDAEKITIRHAELKHLNMPPMTMVFRVADPAMLDQVKTGDKISFIPDKVGGQLAVTQMEVKRQAENGSSH